MYSLGICCDGVQVDNVMISANGHVRLVDYGLMVTFPSESSDFDRHSILGRAPDYCWHGLGTLESRESYSSDKSWREHVTTILKSNDKWMLCHIVTALLVGLDCFPRCLPKSHVRYFRQRGSETQTLEQWLESFPKPSVKGFLKKKLPKPLALLTRTYDPKSPEECSKRHLVQELLDDQFWAVSDDSVAIPPRRKLPSLVGKHSFKPPEGVDVSESFIPDLDLVPVRERRGNGWLVCRAPAPVVVDVLVPGDLIIKVGDQEFADWSLPSQETSAKRPREESGTDAAAEPDLPAEPKQWRGGPWSELELTVRRRLQGTPESDAEAFETHVVWVRRCVLVEDDDFLRGGADGPQGREWPFSSGAGRGASLPDRFRSHLFQHGKLKYHDSAAAAAIQMTRRELEEALAHFQELYQLDESSMLIDRFLEEWANKGWVSGDLAAATLTFTRRFPPDDDGRRQLQRQVCREVQQRLEAFVSDDSKRVFELCDLECLKGNEVQQARRMAYGRYVAYEFCRRWVAPGPAAPAASDAATASTVALEGLKAESFEDSGGRRCVRVTKLPLID